MITERLLRVALLGSAWVLYLLIGLSVVSLSVMAERGVYFLRLRDDVDRLRQVVVNALLARKDSEAVSLLAKSPSIEARVVAAGLKFREGGARAVADAIDGELDRRRPSLEAGLGILGTLGNNAPFVGLLGTVLGVVSAFHNLADTQNKAAMGHVMAAIAEALVATGVGLFVALPAVVSYNAIQKKVADIETSVASFRKLVTAALHVLDRPRAVEAPSIETREVDLIELNGFDANHTAVAEDGSWLP
jgi:biopolymer transport protein ExbB/TolQ